MTNEKLKLEIIDLYYGELNTSLQDLAKKYSVSLQECQEIWDTLVVISQKYQKLPEYQASQMSLNKIQAYANEKVLKSHYSFWHTIFKPVASVAMILIVGFVSFIVWQNYPAKKSFQTALNTSNDIVDDNDDILVKKRLFRTPLDLDHFSSNLVLPKTKKRRFYYPMVTNVSIGQANQDFSLDDEIDRKMLTKSLTSHDLETLFFRARKLEKQGYFEEALYDYVYILKNHPNFEYYQALPLAMARCYENLGDKKSALTLLVSYEKTYGSSQDIELWKDQLKSETF